MLLGATWCHRYDLTVDFTRILGERGGDRVGRRETHWQFWAEGAEAQAQMDLGLLNERFQVRSCGCLGFVPPVTNSLTGEALARGFFSPSKQY